MLFISKLDIRGYKVGGVDKGHKRAQRYSHGRQDRTPANAEFLEALLLDGHSGQQLFLPFFEVLVHYEQV